MHKLKNIYHKVFSFNHRKGWERRDLWKPSALPPCPSKTTWTQFPRTIAKQLRNSSKAGYSITFLLHKLFQSSVNLTVKRSFSSDVQKEHPVIQFLFIVSGLVTEHRWEVSDTVLSSSSLKVFIYQIPLSLCSSRLNSSSSFSVFLLKSCSFIIFVALFWPLSSMFMALLSWYRTSAMASSMLSRVEDPFPSPCWKYFAYCSLRYNEPSLWQGKSAGSC